MPKGIRHRLLQVILLQVSVISLSTILGVYAAGYIVQDVLLNKAMQEEAAFFWEQRETNPFHAKPHTLNLLGFLAKDIDHAPIPENWKKRLATLSLGFHSLEFTNGSPLVFISERSTERLILIINETQIKKLALYFGIAPLMCVLAIIYILSWLTHRSVQSTVSPILTLSRQLKTIDWKDLSSASIALPEKNNSLDSDILMLYTTVDQLIQRAQSHIERERQFTRDASHELRTPLAIIKGSLELIARQIDRPLQTITIQDYQKILNTIERARQNADQLQKLLEILLFLAREDYDKIDSDKIIVNDLISEIVENISNLYSEKNIEIRLIPNANLIVDASENILNILFSNIISNAYKYTLKGFIEIRIQKDSVAIQDSGLGMTKDGLRKAFQPFGRLNETDVPGHGLGLAIVKRFCDHYHWKLQVHSVPNEGTTFEVFFE